MNFTKIKFQKNKKGKHNLNQTKFKPQKKEKFNIEI